MAALDRIAHANPNLPADKILKKTITSREATSRALKENISIAPELDFLRKQLDDVTSLLETLKSIKNIEINPRLKGAPSLLVVDEAWTAMRDKLFSEKIRGVAKDFQEVELCRCPRYSVHR